MIGEETAWHLEKAGKDRAEGLIAETESIRTAQASVYEGHLKHLRLYSEREWSNMSGYSHHRKARAYAVVRALRNRLSLNIVRNMVNASVNVIARSRPTPTFTSLGAAWSDQAKTRDRGRFVLGTFHRERLWSVAASQVCKPAHIFGTGGMLCYRQRSADGKARVKFDRVLPTEIVVSNADSESGRPQTIRRILEVDAAGLAAQYPKHVEAIEKAAGKASQNRPRVAVYSAHRLPSYPGAEDGWHTVAVKGAELEGARWTRDRHPYSFYRWEEEPGNFFGTGIPYELASIQYEINTVILTLQRNVQQGGALRVFAQRGSNITSGHINNNPFGSIIYHDGAPPAFNVSDVFSPQVLQYLMWLVDQGYQITGISQLAAQQRDPGATMSGKARLVHENAQSLRFKTTVDRYEQFFLDLAECVIDEATDEYEQEGDMEVMYAGNRMAETIRWSDVAAPRDEYDLQVYSAAFLSHTPAARMEEADWLYKNGYIGMDEARSLMEIPHDLVSERSRDMSPKELIDQMIEQMLEKGVPHSPTPHMNHDLALERTEHEIQRAMLKEFPKDRIELVMRFQDQVQEFLRLAETPPMAPGPGQMGAGAAMPPGPTGPVPPSAAPVGPPAPVGMAAE